MARGVRLNGRNGKPPARPEELLHRQRYYWEGTPDPLDNEEGWEWNFSNDRGGVWRSEGERIADGFAMMAMGGDG